MKLSAHILIMTSFAATYHSCTTKSNQKNLTSRTNEFRHEIPKDIKGKTTAYYKADSISARLLDLNSLEFGYDSLQIRIWFTYGLLKQQMAIILKNVNNQWEGRRISFDEDIDPSSKRRTILARNEQKIEPKSGWGNLISSLLKLGLTTLPDCRQIEGYASGADVANYDVEIATDSSYRFYTYIDPRNNQIWQAQNMEEILQLLEREFDFKRPIGY